MVFPSQSCVPFPPVVVDMEVDKVASKVVDMELGKVADEVVDIVVKIAIRNH